MGKCKNAGKLQECDMGVNVGQSWLSGDIKSKKKMQVVHL